MSDRLRRRRSGIDDSLALGFLLLGLLVAAALLAPLLSPHDPAQQLDPAASRLRPPLTRLWEVHLDGPRPVLLADSVRWADDRLIVERREERLEIPRQRVLNPTAAGVADRRLFPLGTDALGRDLWARLLQGARVSLLIAVLASLLAAGVGVGVGAAAALGGRLIDSLAMRLVDALLALPALVLLLVLVAFFRPGPAMLVLLIGATGWMGTSRLVRSELLRLRQRDWTLAVRALGQRPLAILTRHLLPNAAGPLLVDLSLRIGGVVLLEASLSFLGLGVAPPTASWGSMIAAGQRYLGTAWWLATFPGIALVLAVLAFVLIADGLRDRLDPHHRAAP